MALSAATQPESKDKGSRHFSAYLVFIIFFMSLGSATYGFSNSIISSTLGQPSFNREMHLDTASNATSLTGAITGLCYAGGIAGAFCHGFVTPRYGPKRSIIVGCLFVIVSSAVLTGSTNVAMFIVFRFFNGWGFVAQFIMFGDRIVTFHSAFQLLCTVPMWITEIVPPKHRGMLADINAVMIGFGYTTAALVGLGFYFVDGTQVWRGPMGLQILFPTLLLCGLYWVPESPRFLVASDRGAEALEILQRLHKGNDVDNFAEIEYYQIRKQIEHDLKNNTTYWEIFTRKSYRKRALITIALGWFSQSCGVLVINNYGALIYSSLGFGTVDTLAFLAGWVALCMFSTMLAMTFVDKVSRTLLLAAGFFGCMVCLILEAALQKHYLGGGNRAALSAAVAMTYLFALVYTIALDGPLFFYVAEIWPSHLRAQGFTIGISAICVADICWILAAPTAFASIGWIYYIFFIVSAAIGGTITLLFFPNTLHKPLEETAAMFGDVADVVVFQHDIDQAPLGKGGEMETLDLQVEDVDNTAKV